jgi:hypothetical protein
MPPGREGSASGWTTWGTAWDGLGRNYGILHRPRYSVGFVTGSVGSFDRVDTLENVLPDCLGQPSLPDTIPSALSQLRRH